MTRVLNTGFRFHENLPRGKNHQVVKIVIPGIFDWILFPKLTGDVPEIELTLILDS